MSKINGFNAVKMLFDEFDSSSRKTTQITGMEIELKNHLLGELKSTCFKLY